MACSFSSRSLPTSRNLPTGRCFLLPFARWLVLCAVVASTSASARPLFPQPLELVDGDAMGIAVGDLNNDGHPDVVVPFRDEDRVQVHLGNGDGSFTSLDPFYCDDAPDHAVIADFDSDGNADLALAKFLGVKGLSVRMGNGDGTFGPETDYAPQPNEQLWSVELGDFNGDAVLDLLGVGATGSVALGNGDGTFSAFEISCGLYFAGVADFNADGMDDYACPRSPNKVRVWLSNGDGTFDLAGDLLAGEGPTAVTAGDVSGDGVPDLIVANVDSDDISVFLGNGDGGFGPEQRHSLGAPPEASLMPWFSAIDDVDGDGVQDLVVSTWFGGYSIPTVLLLYGTGGGQFSAPVAGDWMRPFAHGFSMADFDGDGVKDLIRPCMNGSYVSWLFGDGDGAFIMNRVEAVGEQGEPPGSIALDDLDGDGRLDMAVVNQFSHDVSVLLGNGAGTFAPESRFCVVDAVPPCPEGSSPAALVVGELTGDAHLDLAVANAGSDTVSILTGDGAGGFTFASSYDVRPSSSPIHAAMAIGDLDNDDDADLAVISEGSRRLSVLLGNGDGTFDAPSVNPGTLGTEPTALVLGTLDGDDILDLVVGNAGSDDVTVLLGNGDGTFTPAPIVTGASGPTDVTVGDVNGDQILDLAVSNDGNRTLHVHLGNGDGSFGSPTVLEDVSTNSGHPASVRFADVDRDGKQDLLAATRQQWVFPGNGDGTFGAPQQFVNEATRFATGDFNLDSWLDVVGVSSFPDWVTVLSNQLGPTALMFDADRVTLVWPAVMGALSYNVYRGDLSGLVDADSDGLPDSGYGTCMTALDAESRDTHFGDSDAPSPSGAGFFYLTSVVDAGGDQGLGTTSGGLARVPEVACR